ncbi:TonB-dependent receptor [Luteirhabdus pelagi]|uniref:TonB-dependent receptor n=1 Tax=Luteirhabdus pelagi TaxID=2792783 RepID=UPI00193ACF2C|nr:TonB-dependent receptor [Luteirhabdus pelagi]
MKYLKYLVLLLPILSFSQEKLEGIIYDGAAPEANSPLPGANVFWKDTEVGAVSDFNGNFSINYKEEYTELIISFVGYKTDTITINATTAVEHTLQPKASLDEVTISARKEAMSRSFLQAQNVINVSSDELLKAACCNLAESFETNPSIDVNFADAVTGTRQVKMLGLTSPYILMTIENVPAIRGAAQAYGLSFIPGTWVESIQITKGAGSVVNGFESFTGQINAELQKPSKDAKLFVNGYGSLNGRLELNTHVNTEVTDKISTGIYAHGNLRKEKFDNNDDGFLDMPLQEQINIMNRWQYTDNEKGWVAFFNARYLNDAKQTGQVDFNPDTDRGTTNNWGSEIDTERIDLSSKIGYVNPDLPWQSVGLQLAYSTHDQNSYFGLRPYDIKHESVFASALYNSIISDSRHKFKTGLNYAHDTYEESVEGTDFSRAENSIGAFFEYAYDDLENFSMTAGLRIDFHNLLGTFVTPRIHGRYTLWEKGVFRFSAGRGKRSPNIFAENQRLFASSRNIQILNADGPIYGLEPEIAWNYGASFLQGFELFGRKGDVAFDFYRTDFQNQVVVDWENPTEILFYNLEGNSYSNNYQVELSYSPFQRFNLRTAYKYYDVKTDYLSGEKQKPLTPDHRIFANASYETELKDNGSQWKFDATYNWLGNQRYPDTQSSPMQFQLPDESPTVTTLNAQVTKVFSNAFEVYVGGENITNTRQENPIISANDPFGPYFDTTNVYGPIFGSMYYAGFRFKLK